MAELMPERLAELRRVVEAATPSNEQCPRCGVPWTLGRDVGGRVHTPGGMDCLRRQLAQAQERERAALVREAWLRQVVERVEWVEPPDAHPDWGRWCPMCRSWEAYGHELRCPYYEGLVNGILADAPDKPENPLAAYTDGELYDELRRREWVAATWAREEALLSDKEGDVDDEVPPELVDTACPVCDEPRLWCWCDGEKGGGNS